MNITIQIPHDKLTETLEEVVNSALRDGVNEPYEIISKAISSGVENAISKQLSKRWGDDLLNEIADRVAKAMAAR